MMKHEDKPWTGRTLAAAIRAGRAQEQWSRAASEYLTHYARRVNGRRCLSPIGIPISGSSVRTHCCYVCGATWTTGARWPETKASIARSRAHFLRHSAEHAHDIVRYMVGLLPAHEIGLEESIEDQVETRAQSRVDAADLRARQAEQRAAELQAINNKLILRCRELGLCVTATKVETGPQRDRFELIEMDDEQLKGLSAPRMWDFR